MNKTKGILRKLSKITYFTYILTCITAIAFFTYFSLNYTAHNGRLVKNQNLITPLFLNIDGTEIDNKEKNLIKQINPIGIMLYELNFKSYKQVKSLITDLKNIFPDRKLYIAIDQEGGRVDRIKRITKSNKILKSSHYYAQIATKNLQKAEQELYQDSKNTSKIMKDLGIDINFAPMVDLTHSKNKRNYDAKKSWSATDDRSYGSSPKTTVSLAKQFIKGMHANQIMVTLKHIPGIGRSYRDTHNDERVVIDTKVNILRKTDFTVFKELAQIADFAMVGHAIYSDIDDKPATLSKKTIQIIKNEIGFTGLLISDALNMKSINKIENMGIKALESGIDIIIPNYLSFDIAIDVINNIDKKILVKFNKKLNKLKML